MIQAPDTVQSDTETDSVLRPFLAASTEAEATDLLGVLLERHAVPVVSRTVAAAFQTTTGSAIDRQSVDDVCGDVMLRLVARLQTARRHQSADPIVSFSGYVAVLAYNASYEHLRSRYPQRWRLKNRLRYVLSHRDDLAIWEAADRQWLGGLAEHRMAVALAPSLGDAHAMLEGEAGPKEQSLADTVRAVLRAAGGPVALDTLVGLVAARLQLDIQAADPTMVARFAERLHAIPDPQASVTTKIDRRRYLQELWREIVLLPVRQRAALLLNLRDATGGGAIGLLPIAGVASMRRIAAVLDLAAEEFATLWPRLPLDDDEIAVRLGLRRQQVINLRKSARERLSRRLKDAVFPYGD